MSYIAGQRCDVCGGESPYVPICGECEIAARADVQQDRQARTIRRLRALADGYRSRLASLPTGDATDTAVATMHETEHAGHMSIPDAALWSHGRDSGVRAERARIVARLREYQELFDTAIDIIESEEP